MVIAIKEPATMALRGSGVVPRKAKEPYRRSKPREIAGEVNPAARMIITVVMISGGVAVVSNSVRVMAK